MVYPQPGRFTHHPDEEGTERSWPADQEGSASRASHTIPMKRELKAPNTSSNAFVAGASHTIPMKRELKGNHTHGRSGHQVGFTHHPDEEGTERWWPA